MLYFCLPQSPFASGEKELGHHLSHQSSMFSSVGFPLRANTPNCRRHRAEGKCGHRAEGERRFTNPTEIHRKHPETWNQKSSNSNNMESNHPEPMDIWNSNTSTSGSWQLQQPPTIPLQRLLNLLGAAPRPHCRQGSTDSCRRLRWKSMVLLHQSVLLHRGWYRMVV